MRPPTQPLWRPGCGRSSVPSSWLAALLLSFSAAGADALLEGGAVAVFLGADDAAVGGRRLHAGGECQEGVLPAACTKGNLSDIDWPWYLALLCRDRLQEERVLDYTYHALACFDVDSATACPAGLLSVLLAMLRSGLSGWADQVIRFSPEGDLHLMISNFERNFETGEVDFRLLTFKVPRALFGQLPAPFPPWQVIDSFKVYRDVQDQSQLPELPRWARCRPGALEALGGGCAEPQWSAFLDLLCAHCDTSPDTHGLPCRYSDLMLEVTKEIGSVLADRRMILDCPHGLLAGVLALGSRALPIAPNVGGKVYRVPLERAAAADLASFDAPEGARTEAHVVEVTFRQVAGEAANYFVLNVPLIDLAPFPFHTGMLRSGRLNGHKDASYYRAVVASASAALSRRGVAHVVVPGDGSESMWSQEPLRPRGGLMSIFVDARLQSDLQAALTSMPERFKHLFAGAWRLVQVAPGLWQLGEEPYRFSPRSDVHFRVFCEECVYVSICLYHRDEGGGSEHGPGAASVVPLAPWVPCAIAPTRLFPVVQEELEGQLVPMAFDAEWLRMAWRPPIAWVGGPGDGAACREARRRAALAVEAGGGTSRPRPRLLELHDGFDLSPAVHHEMGLYDLMRLREDSEEPGLRRYSDKIVFKRRLMEEGIPVPKIYHMSNSASEVLGVLRDLDLTRFVAKPTHLAATSFVYVMRDGVNLVNGRRTELHEVAEGLRESLRDRHIDDWATESTPPGIIVEELVEAPPRGSGQGDTPDEFKCQTFFGELFFCEWVFVTNMTSPSDGIDLFVASHKMGDRARPSLGHERCGVPNFRSNGYIFKDMSCINCRAVPPVSAESWAELIRIVEAVARGTDHIRVDVFITPDGRIVVNEANISFLKVSAFPHTLVEEMRRRWLSGYHLFTT